MPNPTNYQSPMDIRSITLFCEPDFDPKQAAAFFAAARSAFSYPVQTTRLATTPFPDWWDGEQDATAQAQSIATRWQAAGADYISLGPVLLRHDAAWLERIPAIIAASDVLFATAEIADTAGSLDTGRCWHMADIIHRVSAILPNGFGNL
ncbi:MAG: DUF711 family protein, partial [Anaerolineales bacterium]|nr:DUF711 family protein [Anaerolineales bacterium]